MEDIEIVKSIYNEIFFREQDYSIRVFLCGKATSDKSSIRSRLHDDLKDVSWINIAMPEIIFDDLIEHPDYNLIDLERKLAEDVDLIVLPLEGLGAICELGAFSMSEELAMKTIVINETKHMNEKSFINLGPIKLLKAKNKKAIIEYNPLKAKESLDKIKLEIRHSRYRAYWASRPSRVNPNNIFNLSRFLLICVAVFQPLTRLKFDALFEFRDDFYKSLGLIQPSLNQLIQNGLVEFDINNKFQEEYTLSESGHVYVFNNLIPKIKRNKEMLKLRAWAIHNA